MIITRRHLSRRAFLRGAGAMIGLPFLDAMVPALGWAQGAARPRKTARTRSRGPSLDEKRTRRD